MLICYYLLLQKKTKEEVASTLEAVQNIQSITQSLQKSKENYNTKSVEQERLKKEGATQKELEKVQSYTSKHMHKVHTPLLTCPLQCWLICSPSDCIC